MDPIRLNSESPLINMRLTAITYAADQINLFEFRLIGDSSMPAFQAGAHIDLHLSNGLVRQYSLINSPEELDRFVVAVKRDPKSRGGSSFIYENLTVGTVLKIGGPRNNFLLTEDSPHSVLVAGGIGITPIWSMINRLESLSKSWELHYAARSRSEAAFSNELERFSDRVHLHIDDEHGGVVMNIQQLISGAPQDAHLYCCGPAPMLATFEGCTKDRHANTVHVEHFSTNKPRETTGGYLVELARCGKSVAIAPGQTILEALRSVGISIPASCEQGICGTCETRVVSGIPDHRDMILSAEEQMANKTMMICCSGSKSDVLVLDL